MVVILIDSFAATNRFPSAIDPQGEEQVLHPRVNFFESIHDPGFMIGASITQKCGFSDSLESVEEFLLAGELCTCSLGFEKQ